jgi:hypothetical protein
MNQSVNIRGTVEKRVYDSSDFEDDCPTRSALSSVDPVEVEKVSNVTVDKLHEYFVDNLDPNNTSNSSNTVISWMALGTDGEKGVGVIDTDLNSSSSSDRFEKQVSNVSDGGKSVTATMTMGSSEGNSNTYDEIGLFNGDPSNVGNNADIFMFNHAKFSETTKTSDKTLSFDVTLTFSDK